MIHDDILTKSQNTTTNPNVILTLLMGYWSSQVLAAALRVDLFTQLGTEGRTAADLSQNAGWNDLTLVSAFLYALSELGFVRQVEQCWYCSKVSESLLMSSSALDMRAVHGVFIGEDAPLAHRIEAALFGDFTGADNLLLSTNISHGMESLSLPIADAIVHVLAGRHPRDILDIGGGSGVVSRYLARYYQDAHFIQVDSADANQCARAAARREGLERFDTIDSDLLERARIISTDVVLACHVLHYFNVEGVAKVLTAARQSLRPKGVLVVADFTPLEGQQWGLFRHLFDLFLRVHSPVARIPSRTKLIEAAVTAGFDKPRFVSLAPRPTNLFVWELG